MGAGGMMSGGMMQPVMRTTMMRDATPVVMMPTLKQTVHDDREILARIDQLEDRIDELRNLIQDQQAKNKRQSEALIRKT